MCGRATTAEAVAAQRLWWQRSNGGTAMGRSDGREGGGTAIAMTAQRRLRRRSDGNGVGGAVMGVAVVAVAVAVAVVHALLSFIAAPHRLDDALLSLSLTSGHHLPGLICGFSGGKKNINFFFRTKHRTRKNCSVS